VEVVEVATDLASWLVAVGDLPSLDLGDGSGERRLLDAMGHPKLLFYALALAYFFLEALLRQLCEAASLAPLLGDFAPRYAVDDDGCEDHLCSGRHHARKLPSIVGAS